MRLAALMGLAAVLLVACTATSPATSPASTPSAATSAGELIGQWNGTCSFNSGPSDVPETLTLILRSDGQYSMTEVRGQQRSDTAGMFEAANGQLFLKKSGQSGGGVKYFVTDDVLTLVSTKSSSGGNAPPACNLRRVKS